MNCARLGVLIFYSVFAELTEQLEQLQEAAHAAADAVNAQGGDVIARLAAIPGQVAAVAVHGVRHGASAAYATVDAISGVDVRGMELSVAAHDAMEGGTVEFTGAAKAVVAATPVDLVVGKLFGDD